MNEKHATRLVWTIVTVIALAIILFFTTKSFVESPRDLGPKLTYVGKEDYGCLPFPISFICPSPKGSNYFFSTNMTEEELSSYFKNAILVESKPKSPPLVDIKKIELGFQLTQSERGFTIDYYSDTSAAIKRFNLQNTNERGVIMIQGNTYETAKSAL